jgi:predicted nucleotidyltransferase
LYVFGSQACLTQNRSDFTLLVALSPAETIAHLRRITTGLQQATKVDLLSSDSRNDPN